MQEKGEYAKKFFSDLVVVFIIEQFFIPRFCQLALGCFLRQALTDGFDPFAVEIIAGGCLVFVHENLSNLWNRIY